MAEFVNFAAGTITDSPLTVGATAVNSAAFATRLPVIATPHTMAIVLDPDGVAGVPEIVLVTDHAAAATVATVIRGQQTSLGADAAREHLAGTTWALGITAIDANRMTGDPGDLKAGIWSSAPTGWLLMGQTVTNADTTYPALWAVVPTSWKSGTSLVLPSVAGRGLVGVGSGGSLGDSDGANSHTLAVANLPGHTHDIDHNHGNFNTSGHSTNHTHTINHNHEAFTTGSGGTHQHVGAYISSKESATGTTYTPFVTAATTEDDTAFLDAGYGVDGAHTHSIDMPVSTGLESGGADVSHTHQLNLPMTAGFVSGSTGSGTAVDHTPANLRINVAIKW
jgi:microcystin-dependent protein